MKKDELLRRLEERLARGEIGEKTYLDIKARYDAMPDVPDVPEPSAPPSPPVFHADHGEHAGRPEGAEHRIELEEIIEQTIENAMEQVASTLETAFGNRKEVERRMEEVNRRLERAFEKFGTQIESDGKRIVVRGAGVVAGDQVTEEFRAAGSCRVAGNLRATEARISGSCVIEGDCICEEFHASGRAEVQGGVKAEEFHVAGKTVVGKDVVAKDVSVSGKVEIAGSILGAEDVVLAGAIEVGGWVRTEDFTSKGRFQIGLGLEAESVDIVLSGPSQTPLIKAEDITVRRGERNGQLLVGTIEAEDVDLESTRATLVKGHEVRIGPFCTVDVVEADELEVHETSTVKERRVSEDD